jgi:hypothetical protein
MLGLSDAAVEPAVKAQSNAARRTISGSFMAISPFRINQKPCALFAELPGYDHGYSFSGNRCISTVLYSHCSHSRYDHGQNSQLTD